MEFSPKRAKNRLLNTESKLKKYKLVISDLHLSAGHFYEGQINPHEDFHFDSELVSFLDYFSSGKFKEHPDGSSVEVELIINGDFLDYLNVPFEGEFEEAITEKVALRKTEIILNAHKEVSLALKRFASLPSKKITYLVGNHDAELFFEKVRERLTKEWDPQGEYPSTKVEIVTDREVLNYEGGLQIRHGNQFEAANRMDFEKPLLTDLEEPVLNLPWGSFYVMKIINKLKWERKYVDKVRPVKVFILIGLVMDTLFTLKFLALSFYYFFKTRFIRNPKRRALFGVTLEILGQEMQISRDLEIEARQVLDQNPEVKTIIMGHTHRPMDSVYPDGKHYINTGTWTRMINIDWSGLGQHVRKTFALCEITEDYTLCELRQWVGDYYPHQHFEV